MRNQVACLINKWSCSYISAQTYLFLWRNHVFFKLYTSFHALSYAWGNQPKTQSQSHHKIRNSFFCCDFKKSFLYSHFTRRILFFWSLLTIKSIFSFYVVRILKDHLRKSWLSHMNKDQSVLNHWNSITVQNNSEIISLE